MQNSPRFPYGYDPEHILVGDVDGDGWISPSTRRVRRSFRVYRLFGWEFVDAKAARTGRQNSLNARYWFERLKVEGNSSGVQKAQKAQGNVMILNVEEK
jgi:hypothetical protein